MLNHLKRIGLLVRREVVISFPLAIHIRLHDEISGHSYTTFATDALDSVEYIENIGLGLHILRRFEVF